MAKKEKPVVDNETGKIKVKAKKEQQPTGNETKGDVTKVVAKMKKPVEDLSKETITKVDLSKPVKTEQDVQPENTNEENVVQEEVIEETTNEEKPTEQITEESVETPVLEEITDEKVEEKVEEITKQAEEAIIESQETGKKLPENIQKLMDFMEDTGGDLEDYVKLNQNYDDLSESALLHEYYKQTKPHLNNEEIDFLMEDQFYYDEETDEDRDIKRKKLALKEQVADAKTYLDGQKSKYYEEIKAGSKLTPEQQKAVDFFNRYNEKSKEDQETADRNKSIFNEKTDQVFNDKFKGFEYNIGDKKYRYNIKNTNQIKDTQSDGNNFFKKFLNENNELNDAAGFHKSIFSAMNADAVAKHFYEQGKADALKESIAKSKNVNMDPRQSHGTIETDGIKVRVLGDNSEDFKFKIKNNKFKK